MNAPQTTARSTPIQRDILRAVNAYATLFRVLEVTGPRQSGKTTLVRQAFPGKPYVTLEDLDTRAMALSDPRAFLARFPNGAILDEVQHAPDLLSYLQGVVDARNRTGDFIITGSQQFGPLSGITQSLAGRVGMLQLLPLSLAETARSRPVGADRATLMRTMWLGGYPELVMAALKTPAADAEALSALHAGWFASYLATYIERDVRRLINIADLSAFRTFVLMCAARSGQLLNLDSLASDCGIARDTARRWLAALEESYIVRLVRPYFRNFGKRLVKAHKLYFLDTGLLCHLLRIDSPETLETHAMRGAIFENWVHLETIKHRWNQGRSAETYFWRDNHGTEIDLLFEHQGKLHAVEIKSGSTYTSDWLESCRRWQKYAGEAAAEPTVVYGGSGSFSVGGAHLLSWRDMAPSEPLPRAL